MLWLGLLFHDSKNGLGDNPGGNNIMPRSKVTLTYSSIFARGYCVDGKEKFKYKDNGAHVKQTNSDIGMGQLCFRWCLVARCTKPLPKQVLTTRQWGLVALTRGQFHRKCSRQLYLICVWNVIIASVNGLSLVRHKSVTGADSGLLSIGQTSVNLLTKSNAFVWS